MHLNLQQSTALNTHHAAREHLRKLILQLITHGINAQSNAQTAGHQHGTAPDV